MTERQRRFFWGNSLAQAVMSAARYHRVEPEALAYRIHEKRHGFVRHPRAVVIEVDPLQPRRPEGQAPSAPVAAAPAPRPAAPRSSSPRPSAPRPAPPADRGERRAPAERERRGPSPEAWDAPDPESESAALEAGRRLLHFCGLEADLEVRAAEDRLEGRLFGADEEKIVARGLGFLEELEHLLPRAIQGLSGRLVRCRLDCGGLRGAHEGALRELALREADRVAASGEPVLLEPLSSADRRVVHLALLDRPDVRTESLGSGARKRVQISPV